MGDGGVEFLAPGGVVGDVLVTALLVFGESCKTLPELALASGCLLYPALGDGDLGLGVGDGLVVVTAPPPSAGVLEPILPGR